MVDLDNYSGTLSRRAAALQRPTTLDELRQLVARHDPARHGAITLRAGGHSFHNQALGKGLVINLQDLEHRVVVTEDDLIIPGSGTGSGTGAEPLRWTTVETTGWTPWEAVLRATLRLAEPAGWRRAAGDTWAVDRYGAAPAGGGNHCAWRGEAGAGAAPTRRFVHYVMVSSGRITPAGSLSGDGIWRFSAVLGRESDSVVWLDLLRADGSIVRLFNARWGLWDHRADHPGREAAPSRADNDRWFNAVIGGFGLVGCIVNIKYLVLELDAGLDPGAFVLSPPVASRAAGPSPATAPPRARYPRRDEHRAAGRQLDTLRAQQAGADPPAPPAWPASPHAPQAELGKVGAEIPERVLTWMWDTDRTHVLFDTLQQHRRAAAAREATRGPIAIPRRVSADTVGCFGLLFTNSHATEAVIGNVAYGAPPPGDSSFLLWDRHYGWTNAQLILRLGLLPWAAGIGEWLVYHHVFEACVDHSPAHNCIPEFGFFMEGHEIAIRSLDRWPGTIQQMWTIPVASAGDRGGDHGRDLVVRFLDAVHRMSRRSRWLGRGVRVQVCDVKWLPAGHAVLSSAPGTDVFAVTVTIENTRGYRRWLGWGSPVAEFRRLSRAFAGEGVKVHLTKNVWADPADLRRMYGAACREFLAIKRTLDPRGVWGSDFLDLLTALAR